METDSDLLKSLVRDHRAAYAAVVDCRQTFSNHTEISEDPDLRIQLPEESYKADFSITPHILAIVSLHLPVCNEHAAEYRTTRPEGFELPPGSILATSDPIATIRTTRTQHP